jgi:hypothetical protein
MVEKLKKGGESLFFCDVCGSGYRGEDLAKKCQEWCSRKKSCSLDIVKHAVTWK